MVSALSSSRLQTPEDLRKLRKSIGWQAARYKDKVQRSIAPLTGLRLSEFVYFSTYALVRLVLPFSSFFMLLETYKLQLQHLSPHSITLVAVFVHLCEMNVGVRPSVRLFRLYHVLRSVGRHAGRIDGYYIQHRVKGPAQYIAAINPGKWDRWRQDWVVM
jgi:hypothetical protein